MPLRTKPRLRFLFLWLGCMAATGVWSQHPRVLLIGFDGLGGYAFPQTNTPHLNRLMQEGSYTFGAKAVIPTVSSPNWASMMNGSIPPKHHIWGNNWKPEKVKKQAYCGHPKGQLSPTIFRVLQEQIPTLNMACVHDWDAFIHLTEKETINTVIDAKGEDETVQKAIGLIQGHTPDFLFLHIDLMDHVGHQIGHNTPAYYQALQKCDSLTGALVSALQQKGIYDDTYILVTSDHGGRLKTHGGLTAAEINIPWIIRGPGIKKGFVITETVKQYDTAATLAKLFGISIPECWVGKPVESVFEGSGK